MEIITIDELLAMAAKDKPNNYADYVLLLEHKSREIFLEEVDSESCKEIFKKIVAFNREDLGKSIHERTPIKIFINSPGGDVTDGYALMDAIAMSKTPVHTIGIGIAYSMGAMILLAGHKRIMFPKASLMLHEGSASLFGDATKVKDTMKFYEKQLKIAENFILQKSKISSELYEQKQANDWYLTAEEALELGLVDELATSL